MPEKQTLSELAGVPKQDVLKNDLHEYPHKARYLTALTDRKKLVIFKACYFMITLRAIVL